MPSNEVTESRKLIADIGALVAEQVDLEQLKQIANSTPTLPITPTTPVHQYAGPQVKIGIAMDEAFGFYYPGDLEALKQAGAKLIPINLIKDTNLPKLDGLIIGGGFPEVKMQALENNASMRGQIRDAIQMGLPAYAECGGLMYLAGSIHWNDTSHEMAGVIPADVVMHDRPQGRGYVRLKETGDSIWPTTTETRIGEEIAAHEFHYSSLTNIQAPLKFAYQVLRGTGTDGHHDGIIINNLLACYAHQRNTNQNRWVPRFVKFVQQYAQNDKRRL